MTQNQWTMLEILDHWGGHGPTEIEIQYQDQTNTSDQVNRLIVSNLLRSLVRKGFAADGENGYDITDRGRSLVEKRRQRQKGTP